jgi:hypothetical protein
VARHLHHSCRPAQLVASAAVVSLEIALKIHAALVEAMKDIAKTGIAKTSRADLGGAKVNYRGIESAMNEMSGILIRNGISVTPAYSDLTITERAKAEAGKATRFVTVKGSFRFAHMEDGSAVDCVTYGEAMDSGDKATIKAQSVAFRTALFQQFVVPTMAIDPEETDEAALPDDALAEAQKGMAAYEAFYKALTTEKRKTLVPHHNELKAIAAEADGGAK